VLFLWFTVYHWSNGSGDFTLIGIQLIALLFIFGWTFIVMGVYFSALNAMGWLRIDEVEELVGMDISRHKGSCYDMSGPSEQDVAKLENLRQANMEDRSTSSRGKKAAPDTPKQEDKEEETA
jgi:Amt family ammonium transporter